METEILDTELLHDLETGVNLLLCDRHTVLTLVPGECLGACSELVTTLCTESVPPCHSKLEPILHRLAKNHFFCIIITVSEGISGILALELDFPYFREIFLNCHS